jgi:hypothetical protein
MGTAWARHAMCESALTDIMNELSASVFMVELEVDSYFQSRGSEVF